MCCCKTVWTKACPKTAIAERLRISRRTVHHWIATGQLERDLTAEVHYRPRPPVPTKLDPYKAVIETRLADFPELTGVRLFEEIQADGYRGTLTQLKQFVRRVRPTPPPAPVHRYDSPTLIHNLEYLQHIERRYRACWVCRSGAMWGSAWLGA